MSFLKAEWRNLAIANYEVEPDVLQEFIPSGTVLDLWRSKCYLSLVGFMFVNTKLLGIKIPFHINFEEVNLRFYVKRVLEEEERRGVVFIKEIVPKPALTFIANSVYHENYETMPMKHAWKDDAASQLIEYAWKKNSEWQKLTVRATNKPSEIEPGSETEFITEHYWGYAKVDDYRTNEYEVTHPRWRKFDVSDYTISIDFEMTYGQKFGFLNEQNPTSVMLAEGSQITVESKQSLTSSK